MASNGVKGERGRIFVLRTDFTVRNKSEFYKCLESVADAEHKAVTFFQQPHYRIANHWVAEYTGDEFGTAVGFIACREASGNHNHLAVID